jgi:hypothetical protein
VASCTRRLWKKKSGATNSSRDIAAKAASIAAVAGVEDLDFQPKASAAFCTSRTVDTRMQTLSFREESVLGAIC